MDVAKLCLDLRGMDLQGLRTVFIRFCTSDRFLAAPLSYRSIRNCRLPIFCMQASRSRQQETPGGGHNR
jgi:hypothetical protein